MKSTLLAAVISGSLAAGAAAAPTPVKPPRISGDAVYLSTLTCHTGTWSSDAVSFTYEWRANGVTISTRRTVRVPLQAVYLNVDCVVTARDARGRTTSASSASVKLRPAKPRMRITKATVAGRTITLTGVISPRQAVSRKGQLVLDRQAAGGGVYELTPTPIRVRPNGHFRVRARDSVNGRHTYVLVFLPDRPGFADQRVKRVLTLA